MKSRADQITELVVGSTLTIHLGVPVEPSSGSGLRIGVLDLPTPAAVGAALKQRLSFSVRWQTMALAALTAMAGSVAVLSWLQGRSNELPAEAPVPQRVVETVAPRPAPTAVQIVEAPYSPADPALPIAPAPGAAPQQSAAPVAVLAAAGPSAPAQAAPVPAPGIQLAPKGGQPPQTPAAPGLKGQEKVEPKPAVLVDEAPAAAPSAAAARPASAPGAAPVPKAPTMASPVPAGAAASKPAAPAMPRGAGLVAITPDGKSALFTNPKSRMPEQFKVGDTLHSGEVVKAIDLKEGRVITNAKEYSLE